MISDKPNSSANYLFVLFSPHMLQTNKKSTKNIYLYYRESGKEALGETIGLIESFLLSTELLHIMFEEYYKREEWIINKNII